MSSEPFNPVAARRRAVRETAYLLLAVLLALVGQGMLLGRTPDSVALGLALLATAGLVTFKVRDIGCPESLMSRPPTGDWLNRLTSPRIRYHVVVAAFGWLLALVIFATQKGAVRDLAGVLYLAAIILGLQAAFGVDSPEKSGGLSRHEWTLLGGIVLIAAFFRLWRIDSLPWGLWYDEAAHGLEVLAILGNPTYRPVYLQSIRPDPALPWYVDAIFVGLLGATPVALRIGAVMAGLLGVVATFALGRRLLGWRTGIVAAAFLAVSSWHVNFSRVMSDAVWSDALNTLAAFFLVRALQSARFRDYAVAGLCLGLGLNGYYSTTLFIAAAALYLAFLALREGQPFLRRVVPGLAVLAAFVVLTAGPLVEFAAQHPDVYFAGFAERSIFGEIQQAGSIQPLVDSVEKHVLMFNYAGDVNGRYNFAGSPELDQVVGALFVVGLFLGLRRARNPAYTLLLIWLPVALAGGIFSVSFEAPQSTRVLDDVVVTTLLAALPLGEIWSRLGWARLGTLRFPSRLGGPAPLSLGAVLALLVFGWSAVHGYDEYFVRQANDIRSWAASSPAETAVGREIAALNLRTTDIYLGSSLLNQPTISFFAPNYHPVAFDPSKDLPFRGPRGVIVFLPATDSADALAIQQLYPAAQVRAFGPPFPGPIDCYEVSVPADLIAQSQGATASYTPPTDTGLPRVVKLSSLRLDWSKQPPPIPFPVTVTLRTTLAAPSYGSYLFAFQGPASGEVYLDENLILRGPSEKTLVLAQGTHTLRVVATASQSGPLQLLWRPPNSTAEPTPIPRDDLFVPPIQSRGLLGAYYPNANWQGAPATERIDRAFDQRFQSTPLSPPYSVEWRGKIDIPKSGLYIFGVQAGDVASLLLDNQPVVQNPRGEYAQGALQLTAGLHDIRIRYQDLSNPGDLSVYWQPPGFSREVLPTDRLFPPQGAYPDRAGPLQPDVLKLTGSTGPVGASSASPTPPAPQVIASIGTLPRAPYTVRQTIGGPGTGDGQFKSPRGVAVDAAGNVYVVDTDLQRISVFDSKGKFVRSWGGPGNGPSQFQEPVDVAIDPKGEVVVLDSTTDFLKVFSPHGTPLRQIGGPALGAYHPRGLAIDPSGNIFIADAGGANLIELAPNGSVIAKLGQRGNNPGQIAEPVGVAVATDGTLFVTDTANNRLSHFGPTFTYIQGWALPKSASVIGPHVAVLPDRSILVSDPPNSRVIHLDPSGQLVDQLGGPGELNQPVGITVDAQGNIYVADAGSGKVVEYGKESS